MTIKPVDVRAVNAPTSPTKENEPPQQGRFGRMMSAITNGTMRAVSTVAPLLPGGEIIKMAANGFSQLQGQAPPGLSAGNGDTIQQMWAMQQENQVYNLQYLQLQNGMQADNRRYSALSNLMKVRHDTAKSAINNMHS